ncbi:MAG: septum formation initiator family protein [Acidimicrobiales bacterium]
MTATRVLTHPAPSHAPARPLPRTRPDLRLVPRPEEIRSRRRGRMAAAVVVVLVCAGLFAILGLRVLLIQGQAQVDGLDAKLASERSSGQQLRVHVAELESPERVVRMARERLGMVTPAKVIPLARAVPAAR